MIPHATPENQPRVYRLASDCPRCGAPIRLCRNRQDQSLFLGCAEWPDCTFVEAYDPTLQGLASQGTVPKRPRKRRDRSRETALAQQLDRAQAEIRQLQARLATEQAVVARLQAECTSARTWQNGINPELLVRRLTTLLTVVHPDRWGGQNPVAAACTREVLRLRDEVRERRLQGVA